MFSVEKEIYSFEHHTDDTGEEWFIVNQDTWYPKRNFTESEAKADYLSETSIQKRYNDTYRVWCN